MPWWGWLITVVVGLIAVYYTVALVFFAKTSKRVIKVVDPENVFGNTFGGKDPFDDPFFKQQNDLELRRRNMKPRPGHRSGSW